jgi:hypothetical protein
MRVIHIESIGFVPLALSGPADKKSPSYDGLCNFGWSTRVQPCKGTLRSSALTGLVSVIFYITLIEPTVLILVQF